MNSLHIIRHFEVKRVGELNYNTILSTLPVEETVKENEGPRPKNHA